MNTQELKAGQRFLVKSGTDIIEYSVQEITTDGEYHRISPATGPYSQWVELRTLDIIHVFEAPNGYLMPQEHGLPAKPMTVMGLDPAWNKEGKAVIATAEVTEDGIKVTDAIETYLLKRITEEDRDSILKVLETLKPDDYSDSDKYRPQ